MEKTEETIVLEKEISELIAKGFELKVLGENEAASKFYWAAYKKAIRRSNLLAINKQFLEEKVYSMWSSTIDHRDYQIKG